MSQTFLYLPTEYAKVPSNELGSFVKQLSILQNIPGISLPKSIVIPTNTLKIIAQANNLQAKIYKLIQEIDYSSSISKENAFKKVEHLITKQSIPKKLADTLLKTYHDYFKKSFVVVKNAGQLPFTDIELAHIHQDTNFVEAILEVWAKMSVEKLKKLMLGINNIHDILFPCPILIQEQLEPKTSGIAYSFNAQDGSKNSISILSTWGIYDPQLQDLDRYLVDSRTFNITSSFTTAKQTQLRRVLGKLKLEDVLVKYQTSSTITTEQLQNLAQLVSAIKKKYLSAIEVLWGIQNDTIFIESVSESDIHLPILSLQAKTLFNLYTITKPTSSINKESSDIAGVVIYDSGKLLASSATHPSEVVKTKQKKYLIEAISRTILKYSDKSDKPVLYRANNFTSTQFNQLQFASLYEMPEANPFLGFRGGLRFTSQQEAFKLELDAILHALSKTKKQITLILPFIRSSGELSQLITIIKKQGLLEFSNFALWLELSTPENVLNLSEYPLNKIQGLVFNLQNMHALITGIDPNNPDVASHYKMNQIVLKKLVEHAINNSKKTKLVVDLTSYDKELLETLCDLEVDGFIINEEVTQLAKKCIIERQEKTIF